ncbi:hypothetical protein JHK87_018657 [Glycine soja]|nr:hypothetical protein JHK87_018657 [Glycine soja]
MNPQDVFGVGGESSATTIIWTRVEMVKNPSVMKKAQLKVRERSNYLRHRNPIRYSLNDRKQFEELRKKYESLKKERSVLQLIRMNLEAECPETSNEDKTIENVRQKITVNHESIRSVDELSSFKNQRQVTQARTRAKSSWQKLA